MASTANRVKPEPGVKQDPEEVGASPTPALDDEDLYEDAGDLEFWDPEKQPYAGNIYLTHVPKYLFDAWQNLDDDAEIRIGTVRQWNETGPKGEPKQRIAMLLDHNNPAHQSLPKEYNLDVKDMQLRNTFLFTEQDLPGFKDRGQNSDIPAHLRRKQQEKAREEQAQQSGQPQPQQQQGGRRKGRYQPYYRKAIPKKTTLAGRFAHELNCQPADTPETKYLLAERAKDAMKPKATTSIQVGGKTPTHLITAGSHTQSQMFSASFVRSAPEPKKTKKQKEERAARLSEADLRDALFRSFEEFSYWSMKAFKQKLRQPEAWLRENLEMIAVLNKSGRFANHWELKPEYKRNSAQSNENAAPDTGFDDSDEDDADDENVEMEDVA